MRVEFRITSGSRAGQREAFDKDSIKVGRHPSSDLKFDPHKDQDVSTHHAEIRIAGANATVHDLGSTNGTFVNNQRVQGSRGIGHGDVIAFGEHGPRVDVIAPDLARPSNPAPKRDTQVRIAEAVEAQTGTMRRMVGILTVVVVAGVGIALWMSSRGSAESEKRIAQLIAQNDSLGRMFASLRGKSASIDSALDAEHRRNEELSRRLASARNSGDQAAVDRLSAEVQDNARRSGGLATAAAVDWQSVNARNAPAMAFIVVDFGGGNISSGTGFNVSPAGLIVTNRHVIRDEKGKLAENVVVKFEGATGKFKQARVIKVSETDELAWLQILVPGTYPVIQGIARNASPRVGAPVALIGYPLGTGTAGMSGANIDSLVPSSTQTLGSVSKTLPDILQLDIFAAQGSSGSPVFNAEGFVVGVLYGSPTESNGRIIYAVPAAKLIAQMPAQGQGSIK